ncbi:MAG: hypothetical protein RL316_1548 [Bacteroidota bacterium]
MEGWSFSIDADSLHVRVRRKRNRMGGKKNHEWFFVTTGLALGYSLHFVSHASLANDGTRDQYSIWTISFF